MTDFTFSSTPAIINELGGIKRIGNICRQLKVHKPLIICDKGIISAGLLASLEKQLSDEKLEYHSFTDVQADPSEAVVTAALSMARKQGIDGVIGFGGGSSMDTAKVIALLSCSGNDLSSVYGVDKAQGKRLPLIQIPTTAGTGSEVTRVAIITTGKTTKSGIVAKQLLPDVALLDAKLTLGLPAEITAATGIDAMVHAIEAYTSVHKKNPYSEMLAKQALNLLANNIVNASHNGADQEARQAMLLGACMAGQAFDNAPVAAVHALAYPLGGHFHIPHGLSNALVLTHVMRFNASHASHLYAELAPIIMGNSLIATQSHQQTSEQLINYLEALIANLGLPNTLEELGIELSALDRLSDDAMLQQRLLVNNPKPLNREDAYTIYKAAYKSNDVNEPMSQV